MKFKSRFFLDYYVISEYIIINLEYSRFYAIIGKDVKLWREVCLLSYRQF